MGVNDAERFAFYEAGEDPTPRDPGTVPTAGQLWYELLRCAPDRRLASLRHALGNGDVARACFQEDHRVRIADLEAECTRLRATLKRAGVREW